MKKYTCMLLGNDCYKSGRTIVPKGVMVHSTGANNPSLRRYVQPLDGQAGEAGLKSALGTNANGNHWNQGNLDVCVHAFVGKLADGSVGVVQTLPWNRRGWHAGRGTSGKSANDTHIAFEICEDGLTDPKYLQEVYTAAVELTAELCQKYALNPMEDGVVICHSEGYGRGIASNHADVLHWWPRWGKDMDGFRRDVAAAMAGAGAGQQGQATSAVQVKVTAAQGLNCRTSPSTAGKVVKAYPAGTTLAITSIQDGWGYTGLGWVSLAYTTYQKEAQTQQPAAQPKPVQVKVTAANGLNCRSKPSTAGKVVKAYPAGTTLTISKVDGSWGYTGAGWVSLKYTTYSL